MSCGRQDQRSERTPLYFTNSLLVGPFRQDQRSERTPLCFTNSLLVGPFRQDQRSERTPLYFTNSLLVGPFLALLMFPICSGKGWLVVGGSIWVEDANIKEGTIVSASPETIGSNVKPGTIFSYGMQKLQTKLHQSGAA